MPWARCPGHRRPPATAGCQSGTESEETSATTTTTQGPRFRLFVYVGVLFFLGFGLVADLGVSFFSGFGLLVDLGVSFKGFGPKMVGCPVGSPHKTTKRRGGYQHKKDEPPMSQRVAQNRVPCGLVLEATLKMSLVSLFKPPQNGYPQKETFPHGHGFNRKSFACPSNRTKEAWKSVMPFCASMWFPCCSSANFKMKPQKPCPFCKNRRWIGFVRVHVFDSRQACTSGSNSRKSWQFGPDRSGQ